MVAAALLGVVLAAVTLGPRPFLVPVVALALLATAVAGVVQGRHARADGSAPLRRGARTTLVLSYVVLFALGAVLVWVFVASRYGSLGE